MKKPVRKDPDKERIFTLRQNTQDFVYIKEHQKHLDRQNPDIFPGCKACGFKTQQKERI